MKPWSNVLLDAIVALCNFGIIVASVFCGALLAASHPFAGLVVMLFGCGLSVGLNTAYGRCTRP